MAKEAECHHLQQCALDSEAKTKDSLKALSPGLASKVFSLASFFTLTCLGKSPKRKQKAYVCHHPNTTVATGPKKRTSTATEPEPSALFPCHPTGSATPAGGGASLLGLLLLPKLCFVARLNAGKPGVCVQQEGAGIRPATATGAGKPFAPLRSALLSSASASLESVGQGPLSHPPQTLLLPAILNSPSRRMCGQRCSVLIRKGLVTPKTTLGLRRGRRTERREPSAAGAPAPPPPGHDCSREHLRRLCPGGVLLELAIVDGEIGTIVAAVLQRSQATEERCVS